MVQGVRVEEVVAGLEQEEEEKGFVVVPAHAVADPEAVVVESLHAHLALPAVLRAVVAHYIAHFALEPTRLGRDEASFLLASYCFSG